MTPTAGVVATSVDWATAQRKTNSRLNRYLVASSSNLLVQMGFALAESPRKVKLTAGEADTTAVSAMAQRQINLYPWRSWEIMTSKVSAHQQPKAGITFVE